MTIDKRWDAELELQSRQIAWEADHRNGFPLGYYPPPTPRSVGLVEDDLPYDIHHMDPRS